MKINKNQTYQDQCKEKRRPRITFSQIKQQLNNIELIFDGHINDILDNIDNIDNDLQKFINLYYKIKYKLNNNELDKIIKQLI